MTYNSDSNSTEDRVRRIFLRAAAYSNRGVTWEAKGEVGRAMEDYQKALEIDPGFINAQLNPSAPHLRREPVCD